MYILETKYDLMLNYEQCTELPQNNVIHAQHLVFDFHPALDICISKFFLMLQNKSAAGNVIQQMIKEKLYIM